MDFGLWITSIRQEKGITLRAFARHTGIPFSTLQRIETAEKANVSLQTAFRICRALAVSVEQLIRDIGGMTHNSGENDISRRQWMNDRRLLTCEDVLAFIKDDGIAERSAWIILDLIKNPPHNEESLNRNPRESIRGINATEISLPFFKSPVFDVSLQYPIGIKADVLSDVYLSDGALTLAEIGQMIRSARLGKKERLRDLVVSRASSHPRFGETSSITNSISTLSRLETGTVGSIGLDLTLWLSQILYDDARLIKMYWNSPQLYERRTALPLLPGLWIKLDVNFYIVSGRWLGLLYGDDTSWVNILRNVVQTRE